MTTESVTVGSADLRVIVWTAKRLLPLGGMLKAIRSGPPTLGLILASRMAWRKEPGPLSFTLKTVNVERRYLLSSASRQGRNRRAPLWGARFRRDGFADV